MSNVYFKAIDSYLKTEEISKTAADLLMLIQEREKVSLNKYIPLKVHLGEKGNTTFIEPKNFSGIIDYLEEQNIKTAFIETNVLYKGQRNTKKIIQKNFKTCMISWFNSLNKSFNERLAEYALAAAKDMP